MADFANTLTVVIASLCDDQRSELLKRACASVGAMAEGFSYSITVVANGDRVSPAVLSWLSEEPNVQVVRLRTGSHPLARRVGAEMADSEFLCFLDDDDELMSATLAHKIAYFREHPEVDVVITDGYRIAGATETRVFPPPNEREEDFILTLMKTGWGAGSLTLRLQNVDLSVIDTEVRHVEWTLITLTLAKRYEVGYIDEPMYRYYEDTANSLSKSAEHSVATPEVWRRLSALYAGTQYANVTRRRYGLTAHNAAWAYANRGEFAHSWQLHLDSLRAPGGMGYVLFTIKLLYVTVRSWFTNGIRSKPARPPTSS